MTQDSGHVMMTLSQEILHTTLLSDSIWWQYLMTEREEQEW